LHFNGQAEDALHFYEAVFAGKVTVLSRFSDGKPESGLNQVMHARLEFDGNTLMLSDSPHHTVSAGDNIALSINLVQKEVEANKIFAALSGGGKVVIPLEEMFWGALFGITIDRFGIRWKVNCDLSI